MRYVILILNLFFPLVAIAASEQSLGQIATNLMEPVNIVAGFTGTASIIIGLCMIFGSIFRYSQYRVNHHAMPLSSVIMLLIFGILLLSLPFAYKLTQSGIPYTLL